MSVLSKAEGKYRARAPTARGTAVDIRRLAAEGLTGQTIVIWLCICNRNLADRHAKFPVMTVAGGTGGQGINRGENLRIQREPLPPGLRSRALSISVGRLMTKPQHTRNGLTTGPTNPSAIRSRPTDLSELRDGLLRPVFGRRRGHLRVIPATTSVRNCR
jgi:hypothetical protein